MVCRGRFRMARTMPVARMALRRDTTIRNAPRDACVPATIGHRTTHPPNPAYPKQSATEQRTP